MSVQSSLRLGPPPWVTGRNRSIFHPTCTTEIILLLQLRLLEEFFSFCFGFVCLFSLRKSIGLFCKIVFPGMMVPAHFYWNQCMASVADSAFGSNPACPVLGCCNLGLPRATKKLMIDPDARVIYDVQISVFLEPIPTFPASGITHTPMPSDLSPRFLLLGSTDCAASTNLFLLLMP